MKSQIENSLDFLLDIFKVSLKELEVLLTPRLKEKLFVKISLVSEELDSGDEKRKVKIGTFYDLKNIEGDFNVSQFDSHFI